MHTYTTEGEYTAKLTVSDGHNTPVVQTLNFRVFAPLATAVSANGSVVAGDYVLFTITVGNTTAQPIDNVIVSFSVPAGLSFNAYKDAEPNVSSGCATCNPSLEPIWNLGTLAAGETRTITVNALVDAATLDGTGIDLSVDFSGTSINPVNIVKTIRVSNTPKADLALGATADPVVPNGTYRYELEVGTLSGSALTNMELRAFLPPGVVVTHISDGGSEQSPGVVVWNAASLAVTRSLRRTVTVTADTDLIAGQILKARAELAYDGGSEIDHDAENVVTVTSPDVPLQVDIGTSANPAVADEYLLYTITISNISLLPVDDVSVQIRVPEQLSFNAYKDAEPNVSSGCATCNPSLESTWNLGTLAAGESRTITVNALVDSVLSGTLISLPLRVTATGMEDTIDLLKTVAVFNSPAAELALSASTDPVTANETFTYSLDFGNTGSGALSTVELRAYLPPGVTVSSISDGGTDTGNGEIVWNEGSLGVGESRHREVTVVSNVDIAAGQILKTTARLRFDGGLELDQEAENVVTVTSPDVPLQVDIGTSANPAVADEYLLYTITISNISLLPVDDVSVQIRVPEQLSFNAYKDAEPNVSSGCATCNPSLESTWNLGTLAAGESRTITVNALVDSVLSGTLISLPLRVTATGMEDTIDLLKTVAVFNSPAAELALSASTDPVTANETFTYSLDFGNTGSGALSTVELRAYLPPGVTVSSISDGGTDTGNGEIVWNEGSLGVGESRHREVTVTADGSAAGDILALDAELTHTGGNEVDQQSEFAVSVAKSNGRAALLSVDLVATPDPVAASGTLNYKITVTNGFGLPVDNVEVQMRVPAEFSFNAYSNANPDVSSGCATCSPTNEATWNLGIMTAGASQVITINAAVAAGLLDGTLINVPIRVTVDGIDDTINLQHTTAVQN